MVTYNIPPKGICPSCGKCRDCGSTGNPPRPQNPFGPFGVDPRQNWQPAQSGNPLKVTY